MTGAPFQPGWQPIETAPKDGDPVLLYKRDERMVGEYMLAGYWGEWPGQADGWIAVGGKPLGYYSKVAERTQGYPTHWMPLPEAPEAPETHSPVLSSQSGTGSGPVVAHHATGPQSLGEGA